MNGADTGHGERAGQSSKELGELLAQLRDLRDGKRDRIELDGSPQWSEAAALVNELNSARAAGPAAPSVLEYIIAHVPHSIFWKDFEGRFQGGNHNLLRDLGLTRLEQLVGRTDHDFGFSPEQVEFFRRVDMDVMQSGRAILDIEEKQDQADGTHTLLTSKVPLRDPDGVVNGLLGIYVDISERKRMEVRLQDAYQALADRHEELKAAHQQLRATQAQLVHSAKIATVGTLVAGLCHELNNPLSVILMNTQVLLARTAKGEPEVPKALHVIERNTRRCAQLVSGLLDFSRKKEPVRERLHLAMLFERIALLVGSRARRSDVRLVFPAEVQPVDDVTACVQEIETALLNLIGNALDATPAGGAVEVSAQVHLREGRRGLELSVRDTGPGIDTHILPHVFDPFFTTKPVGQGTGLGLSISRKIVEDHQGAIDIDTGSAGTTVRIWLPASPTPITLPSQGART